jgi:hypothetical protein
MLPSLLGSVGLFRLSTAETGGLYQLRMGFHGEYSNAGGLPHRRAIATGGWPGRA